MKRKFVILSLVLVLMMLPIVACAPEAPAPTTPSPTTPALPSNWPESLSIVTSTPTGTFYVICAAASDMLTKYVKIPSNVETAGGSAAAMTVLGDGLAHLALVTSMHVDDGFWGRKSQEKPAPVRSIMKGHGGVWHLFTLARSGIKTIDDMNGRKFQYVKEGTTQQLMGSALVECANLDLQSIPTAASTQACVDAVVDGSVDVSQATAIGSASLREMFLRHDTHLISIPEDVRDCMMTKHGGFVKNVVPKGYYEGYDGKPFPAEDVPSVGYDSWLIARDDVPEDLIYELCKAIMDHPDEFSIYHTEAQHWCLENATANAKAPFHPGAIKYYKEKGVWTEELQKLNDDLLAKAP